MACHTYCCTRPCNLPVNHLLESLLIYPLFDKCKSKGGAHQTAFYDIAVFFVFFLFVFVFFIGTYNNFRIKRRDNLNETNFVDQYVKTTKENTFCRKGN